MKTIEYLNATKAQLGIQSDYALAAELGVTRSAISKLQQGGVSFGDDVALKIADILGRNPLEVIAAANSERAKDPEMRKRWLGLVAGFLALLPLAKTGVRFALPR